MDWNLAIRRNREALMRVLAALLSLVGLEDGQSEIGSRQSGSALAADCRLILPRHLHAHVLRILRATEAAIRRLVVIAARDVAVTVRPGGGAFQPDFCRKRNEAADAPATLGIPAFPLLDPLRKFSFDPPRRASKFFPRICVVGYSEPAPLPEKPVLSFDDPINATGIHRRLLSSRRALENLPAQARRLARWKARNKLKPGPGRVSPLRMGRPPGRRKRSIHAVDDILKECHALALDVLSPPNTS
ncbi:MAG: hypothetical protein WDZ83_06570 [Rhizobiaceae bacterium]